MAKKMHGIDVSRWQKGIDFSKIDCDFVILKASEGLTVKDPCFVDFANEALKLGKKLGFYHFARPTKEKDPRTEAKYFYETVKDFIGKGIAVLDWESEDVSNVLWAKEFLDEFYRLSGVKPLIYMNYSTANGYDWSLVSASGYDLWLAKYRSSKDAYNYDMSSAGIKPSVKHWKSIAMWQWTSTGILNGYKSHLDCDVFYGDEDAWNDYAGIVTELKPLNQYTDEKLAEMVKQGLFGNGEDRKKALGARYESVQKIVNGSIGKKVYHKVVKGDVLSKIAKQYGTTVNAIMKLNRIHDPNMIVLGQMIRVK